MVEVRSPTTGIVIEIKVKRGDNVNIDDELLIVESMKMHIPVNSPADGKVDSVTVHEGDQVAEDDIVMTVVRQKEGDP